MISQIPTKNPLTTKAGKLLNNRGGALKQRQSLKTTTLGSGSKTTTINIELGASTSGSYMGKKTVISNMPQSCKNQLGGSKQSMLASVASAALTSKHADANKRKSGMLGSNHHVPKLNLKNLD